MNTSEPLTALPPSGSAWASVGPQAAWQVGDRPSETAETDGNVPNSDFSFLVGIRIHSCASSIWSLVVTEEEKVVLICVFAAYDVTDQCSVVPTSKKRKLTSMFF